MESIEQSANTFISNIKQVDNEDKRCKLCKDSRMIAIHMITGERKPSFDVVGLWDTDEYRMQSCTCITEQEVNKTLETSGISLTEYKSKTFDSFKTFDGNSAKMKKVAMDFVNNKEAKGSGFYGNSGAGKTHICIAICNELAKKGIGHRYFEYRKEMTALVGYQKYNQDEYTRVINIYKNCNVLYIDDLFKFAFNDNGGINVSEFRIMFDILNHRMLNNKKVIISCEFGSTQLSEFDAAIGSRIIAMTKDYACGVTGQNVRVHKIKD